MSSESKQWYFHTGSQQEGPLSREDLIKKINDGSAQLQHFAWSPGMANWIPISEISELNSSAQSPQPPPSEVPPENALATPIHSAEEPQANHELSALIELSQSPHAHEKTATIYTSVGTINMAVAVDEAKFAEKLEKNTRGNPQVSPLAAIGKLLSLLIIALAIAGLGTLIWISYDPVGREKVASIVTPYVAIKFYKIPKSFNLSATDLDRFESAANAPSSNPEKRSFAIAFTVPQSGANPTIAFAGAWPDKSTITVLIKGTPITLVGTTHHHDQVQLKVDKHIASAQLNHNLPRGEYVAILTDSDGNRTIGEAALSYKDQSYAKDLNTYHDAAVARLKSENQGLKSFADAVTTSLDQQAGAIQMLRMGKNLTSWKTAAKAFRDKNHSLLEQLTALTASYKPDTLKNDFYLWAAAQRALVIHQAARTLEQQLDEVLIAKNIVARWKSDQAKLVSLLDNQAQELKQLNEMVSASEALLTAGQFITLMESSP